MLEGDANSINDINQNSSHLWEQKEHAKSGKPQLHVHGRHWKYKSWINKPRNPDAPRIEWLAQGLFLCF